MAGTTTSTQQAATPTVPTRPRGDWFGRFAAWAARVTGGRWAFVVAGLSVVIWAITGPFFQYSENWQLVINTGTSVATFLMVFLIQNSQNRESKAVQLKLDELIRSVNQADNRLINVENLTDEQLDTLGNRYRRLATRYHEHLEKKLNEVHEEVREVIEDAVEDAVEDVVDRNCLARVNGKKAE